GIVQRCLREPAGDTAATKRLRYFGMGVDDTVLIGIAMVGELRKVVAQCDLEARLRLVVANVGDVLDGACHQLLRCVRDARRSYPSDSLMAASDGIAADYETATSIARASKDIATADSS